VDHIAETAGFSDRFYLSRVFKTLTGKSPAQYRKAHTRDTVAI
jgi:AraC-like DNA-binding protein